jgi:glycosyltransferase involved in cell wall biosynthesis
MKPKVLIVPTWYPSQNHPLDGIFVQDQVQVLSREFDVAVLYAKLIHLKPYLREGIPKPSEGYEEKVFTRRDYGFAYPRLYRQWFGALSRIGLRAFRRLISTWGKPDLIHSHIVLPGGWIGATLKKEYSIPLILTEHSSPFSIHLGSSYKRELVQDTLEACDKVIAVSPGMQVQMKGWVSEEKTEVIGNVIRSDFFKIKGRTQDANSGPKTMLCVCIMKEQKGLLNLIKACRELLDSGQKDFTLYLGGDGELRPQLQDEAKRLGLGGHCVFLGIMDRETVREWMQRCDFFVLPSLHETFGIVVAEAMACGKPVIATRCGGPEFTVTPESGILVQPGDITGLKEAMHLLMTQPNRFDPEVIRNSVTSRFGVDVFLSRMSNVYEEVLGKQKSPE